MGLISLSLCDFRCFERAELKFSPGINLIFGANASGKTSVLEAAFLLGRGRSFRSGHLDPLSRFGSKGFQVVGRVDSARGQVTVGLGKEQGGLNVRVGGRSATGLAELAETLPVQLIDSQAHMLIDGGPRHRRQFLDWGVFHVEPGFFPVWRRYQRALQQRNALLRTASTTSQISGWDNELAAAGRLLDAFRRRYLESLAGSATRWAGQALGGLVVQLDYRQGWPEDQDLVQALSASRERDRAQGATQTGPHRADVTIKVDGRPARDRISRGQEKVLAGTLLLAQAAQYRVATGHACVLLLDDLPSELDPEHLARFAGQILEAGAQTLITAVTRESLPPSLDSRVFHVEQGKTVQVV
jgi:DNA replication and repair protein RecF